MSPLAAFLATLAGPAAGQTGTDQPAGAGAGGDLFAALLDAANAGQSGQGIIDPNALAAAGTSEIQNLGALLGADVEALILPEGVAPTALAIPLEGESAEAGAEGQGPEVFPTTPTSGGVENTTASASPTPLPGTPVTAASRTSSQIPQVDGAPHRPDPAPLPGTAEASTPKTSSNIPQVDGAPHQVDPAADQGGQKAGAVPAAPPPAAGGSAMAQPQSGTAAGSRAPGSATAPADAGPGGPEPDAAETAQRRAEPTSARPSANPEPAPRQADAQTPGQRTASDKAAADAAAKTTVLKTVAAAATGQALLQIQETPAGEPSQGAQTEPGGLTLQLRPAASTAAPPPAAQTPQVPVHSLAVHIAQQAQNGARRFEISLDPPELGRVQVRLDVTREGQVSTHLVVERSETLDLLQRDARSLERALQNAGLDTSEGDLTFSLKDQGLAHGEARDAFDDMLQEAEEDDAGAEESQLPPPDHYTASTGLDIRI